MPKLTAALIARTQPDPVKEIFLWHEGMEGFGVRIRPGGSKTYILQYRPKTDPKRTRRMTVGRVSDFDLKDAIERAQILRGEVSAWKDPQAELRKKKNAKRLDDAFAEFMAEHVAKRSEKTRYDYRLLANRLILPAFGRRPVDDIVHVDVARWHSKEGARTPMQANRALAVFSVFMEWCIRRGYRTEGDGNPCRRVEKFREEHRQRYLSAEESRRLADALDAAEREGDNPHAIAAIWLLMFTGARKDEIRTAKWDYLSPKGDALNLPRSKTGFRTIYLPAPAREVLSRLPRIAGNPYIIGGSKPGAPLHDLEKPWRRIRDRAGLGSDDPAKTVRLHDLRHTFASRGAESHNSLAMIGKVLGHRVAATTKRYAHIGHDPARDTAEGIAATLASETRRAAPAQAEVVHLTEARRTNIA